MMRKNRESFHGFHSQREETTHSLQAKSRVHEVDQYNLDLKLQFSIHHTIRGLIQHFRKALKKQGYKCVEITQREFLAIRLTFTDKFFKLFCCKQPPKFTVGISTHEFLSLRQVSVRPLRSNSPLSHQDSIKIAKEVRTIGDTFLNLRLQQQNVDELSELDSQYKQDFFSLDATSYYMFGRMLVQKNYSLGRKVQEVGIRFEDEPHVEQCPRNQLRWLSSALNEISDDLLEGFNCSRKELLEILAYCRKSVQVYFFTTHLQHQANLHRPVLNFSEGFDNERKELAKILPMAYKQFLLIEHQSSSMDILVGFFKAGIVFQAQCQSHGLSQDQMADACKLVKTCFSGLVGSKSKMLTTFGYPEDNHLEFVNKFRFDHEVTF